MHPFRRTDFWSALIGCEHRGRWVLAHHVGSAQRAQRATQRLPSAHDQLWHAALGHLQHVPLQVDAVVFCIGRGDGLKLLPEACVEGVGEMKKMK